VSIALTHFIRLGWVKNLTTSILAFDIMQFFPFTQSSAFSFNSKQSWFQSQSLEFFQELSSQ